MNHFSNMPDSTITLELEWDGGFGKKVVEGCGSDINFAKERKDPNSPYYEAPKPDPFGLRTWTASVKFWGNAIYKSPANYRMFNRDYEKAKANLKECIHAAESYLECKRNERRKRHAA